MKIKYFYPHWGSEHMEFGMFCEQVSSAHYDGVEINLSMDPVEKKQHLEILKPHGLELLAQHALTRCPDFEEHLEQYSKHIAGIAKENPLIITTHAGRDWFSYEQNQEIIATATQVSKDSGMPVVHETHRGRFNFCAATTYRFLEADPVLRLCAVFSHWCTVSESFLSNQSHFAEAAIQIFLGWWDKIVACHEEKGSEFLAHHHRVRPDTIHANPAADPTACCEPVRGKPAYV